jgi:alginate O-acetyltransferase complex protein AlgI
MLFNSIGFSIFFVSFVFIYWTFCKSVGSKNILFLIGSYFFYGCWDWCFLFLLAFSTLLDFYCGIKINQSIDLNQRKFWLYFSIILNVGCLAFFKYFNFFVDSFVKICLSFGFTPSIHTLNIILPVGISFYTFHGLSYIFDIYNKKLTPTYKVIDYAVFVSFFPLLVAGPIERASHLLHQVERNRFFTKEVASNGLRQMLWGFFKKIVIADNCAPYVNLVFNDTLNYHGSALVLGVFLFSFQIYGDFSGYSDIAIGSAKVLGFDVKRNFAYPYFSRDIAEFWRRWNISLTTWFRDYLYLPLGGNKISTLITLRNTIIVFILSGFWHGANWTFIIWGMLNACFFIPLLLTKKNRTNVDIIAPDNCFPSPKELLNVVGTFTIVSFSWIFFRADNLKHAFIYLFNMFDSSFFSNPFFIPSLKKSIIVIAFIVFFLFFEWIGRKNEYAIEKLFFLKSRLSRWLFYATIIFIIAMYGQSYQTKFVYFQF